MDLQALTNSIKPKIALTTAYPNRTPILYHAQAGIDATFTTPSLSLATIPNTQIEHVDVTLSERRAGGNECTITARDFPTALTLWRNGFVRVYMDWDTGAGGTASTLVFQGYIDDPEPEVVGGQSRGQRFWKLTAHSFGAKLTDGRKKMIRIASLGGWSVEDLATTCLTGAGLPSAYLSVAAAVAALELPGCKDERRFDYAARENVGRALDEALAEVNCEWGESMDGGYALTVGRKPAYTAPADDTLSVTDTPAETVVSFRYSEDSTGLRNFYWVEGEGKDGGGLPSFAYEQGSLDNASSAHFVGEWWDEVATLPDGYNVSQYARRLQAEALEMSRTAEWVWHQAHLDVYPSQFIEANLASLEPRVANGTIFRVLQKRVTWQNDSPQMRETYTGVRVT